MHRDTTENSNAIFLNAPANKAVRTAFHDMRQCLSMSQFEILQLILHYAWKPLRWEDRKETNERIACFACIIVIENTSPEGKFS